MRRGVVLSLLVALSLGVGLHAQDEQKRILGKTSGEWLKLLATETNVKKKQAALIALKVFGPTEPGVIDGLIRALQKDKAPEVRQTAAQYLGELAGDAKTAVLPLGKALAEDPSAKVREAAARALGDKMVPFAKPAVPVLGKALKDPDPEVREAAKEALGKIESTAHTED